MLRPGAMKLRPYQNGPGSNARALDAPPGRPYKVFGRWVSSIEDANRWIVGAIHELPLPD